MRVKIGGLQSPGFIADRRGVDIPPDAWTEVKNVRFNYKGAQAFQGHTQVFGTPGETGIVWLRQFPPIDAPIWVYTSLTEAWAYDGTNHTEITNTGGDYTAVANERWQGGVLNGVGIFNNTIDVPQLWSQFSLATPLVDLTNWPSTLRCKALRPHGFFLFAMHLTESGSVKPYRVRVSHPAAPGTVPSSWDITDPTIDARQFELAETDDYVVDGLTLGDVFIIYKQHNAHAIRYVGRPSMWAQNRILEGRGILARDCAHAIKGGHFVAGLDDIYIHQGARGTDQSIVEAKLRNWIYNQIDADNFFNCYTVDYRLENESWFCFPEAGETYPTLAYVWNRITGGGGIRQLFQSPFISSGAVPVVDPADDGTWGE